MTYKENDIKEFPQNQLLLIHSKMSMCHTTDVRQKIYQQGWRKTSGKLQITSKMQNYFLC